jgi:hypothetical protein
MSFLDRFIVNVATSLLRGVMVVSAGAVYAQLFLFAAFVVTGAVFVLTIIAKALLVDA